VAALVTFLWFFSFFFNIEWEYIVLALLFFFLLLSARSGGPLHFALFFPNTE